jgi:hypothetical protein
VKRQASAQHRRARVPAAGNWRATPNLFIVMRPYCRAVSAICVTRLQNNERRFHAELLQSLARKSEGGVDFHFHTHFLLHVNHTLSTNSKLPLM